MHCGLFELRMPSTSDWNCIRKLFADAPPSTLSVCQTARPRSSVIAFDQILWSDKPSTPALHAPDASCSHRASDRAPHRARMDPNTVRRVPQRQAPRMTPLRVRRPKPAIASDCGEVSIRSQLIAQPLHRRARHKDRALQRIVHLCRPAPQAIVVSSPLLRNDRFLSGIHQQETAGPVGILCLRPPRSRPVRTALTADRPPPR